MIIEIEFAANQGRQYMDYIELTNDSKTVTLDWDVSEISPGNVVGRGVYIKDAGFAERFEKEGSESFAYGNGRIDELAGMWVSGVQIYDEETGKECTDVVLKSVTVYDGDRELEITC